MIGIDWDHIDDKDTGVIIHYQCLMDQNPVHSESFSCITFTKYVESRDTLSYFLLNTFTLLLLGIHRDGDLAFLP